MKHTCRVYPVLSAPMPFQMALDELLFRQVLEERTDIETPEPVLRFYYASDPWYSVGYAYAGWKHLASGLATAGRQADLDPSIPVCRRVTGGGRVLHGSDLMFTLVAPKGIHESFSSVRISYLKIHEILKASLDVMGYSPEFYRCDESLPHGKDCFVFPIATDLRLKGKKIAGGGQKRSMGLLMHQESVQLGRKFDYPSLIESVKNEFSKHLDLGCKNTDLNPELLLEAEHLGAEQYYIPKPGSEKTLQTREEVLQ